MNASESDIAERILRVDQYQVTMAQLYHRMGLHEIPARFEYFFRTCPDYGGHRAGYCISAGLEWLVKWMTDSRFREEDLAALRNQRMQSGEPLFSEDFLNWLRDNGDWSGVTLRAVPEGRVVHPNVSLVVVEGPLIMAQILETALLNHLNYQTLIATKAARVRESARGRTILEFGLRRAQERAASAGARAALIGGADFTSNVGISRLLGQPPKGTHAHSMVQAFMALGEGELAAFRAYAEVYPDDCLLLVDTINTLESGVPNAIRVFEELRAEGHEPVGIRLDSGDLAYLSIRAAAMLDKAGFDQATIVLSNQLDEMVIWQIVTQIEQEASRYGVDPDSLINRLVYGVGTGLITSAGCGALDGVYKLVALRRDGAWQPAIKVSETREKTLNPGEKRVWRLYDERGKAAADLLCLADEDPRDMKEIVLRHPTEATKRRTFDRSRLSECEELLVEVIRDGRPVGEFPTLDEIRRRRDADRERLDPGVRRLINPHVYHVSLSQRLWDLKQSLIEEALGGAERTS